MHYSQYEYPTCDSIPITLFSTQSEYVPKSNLVSIIQNVAKIQKANNFQNKLPLIGLIQKENERRYFFFFCSCCILNHRFLLIECVHGYEYDKTWYDTTVVSQENWVCEKDLYQTNTYVFIRIGEVIGTFFFGQLGDQ